MHIKRILSICSKKEEGQSIVEFAIVLPLLLLIICGIIELGLFLNVKLTLNNCTRDAARYASINSNDTNIQAVLTDRVSQYSILKNVKVNVTYSDVSHRRGDVTVNVSAVYNSITPIGKLLFFSNHKIISNQLIMKVE